MQGVDRVLSVLEAVAFHHHAGVGELARALGLPKSTVQRHLWALANAGWIRPVGEEYTRWTLTSRALLVGQRGSREGQLREVALQPMRDLRDATHETVTLQVPASERDVTQIERVDSDQPVRTFVSLGEVFPMCTTSGGLAYLAALPVEEADAVLEGETPVLTEHTEVNVERLRVMIAEIRTRGYAINISMNRTGVCAVGAAIRGEYGRPVAALGISVPENRFDSERVPVLGQMVMDTAAIIETRI